MKIITGIARGVKLQSLEGNATRPTTEMAKEAIFSAIQFDLTGRRVLDLFGGSGQMALEALSRGCASAVICDSSRQASEIIKANAQKTKLMQKCRILTSDWKDYLNGAKGRDCFDLVFLDPPYADLVLDEVLDKLSEYHLLSPNAILVCESSKEGIPTPRNGFTQKLYHYGKSYVSIFRTSTEEEEL